MANAQVGCWFDISGPMTTTASVVGTAITAPTTDHHHGTVRRSWNCSLGGFGTDARLRSRAPWG